jgi:hypothetical protein
MFKQWSNHILLKEQEATRLIFRRIQKEDLLNNLLPVKVWEEEMLLRL